MTRPTTPGTLMLKPRHISDLQGTIFHPTQGCLPLRWSNYNRRVRGLQGSASAIHQAATRMVMVS